MPYPQPELYSDWKEWARQLLQQLTREEQQRNSNNQIVFERLGQLELTADDLVNRAFAELAQQQGEVSPPEAIFDGSGTDDDTWIIVDSMEYTPENGRSILMVLQQSWFTILQISNDPNATQAPAGGSFVDLKYRLVRYNTDDPPADSTVETDAKLIIVWDPDEPITLPSTGSVPAPFVAQFDEPDEGNWTYEYQVKWQKRIYDIGTVTVAGGGDETDGSITASGTRWRSLVSVTPYIADYVTSVDVPYRIRVNNGSWSDWKELKYIISQTSAVTKPGDNLPNGSSMAYEIDDPTLAPEVDQNFKWMQVFELKAQRDVGV